MTVDPGSRGAGRRAGRHVRDRVRRDPDPKAAAHHRGSDAGRRPRCARRRRAAHVLGTDPTRARPGRPLSVRGRRLPDPGRRRGERQDARSHARRADGRGRIGATRDPLPPDEGEARRLDGRPGRGTALPGRATARPRAAGRPPTGRATAARRADAGGRRRRRHRSTRRTARHATLRSGRGPPTSRTSASSTRTATGSTGRRRMRSSSRHSARTTIRARDKSRSGRSRRRFRRQRRRRSAHGRYVIAAEGTYGRVEVASGIAIYGGYAQGRWAPRDATRTTLIVGAPEGILAAGATQVLLQHLSVRGNHAGGECVRHSRRRRLEHAPGARRRHGGRRRSGSERSRRRCRRQRGSRSGRRDGQLRRDSDRRRRKQRRHRRREPPVPSWRERRRRWGRRRQRPPRSVRAGTGRPAAPQARPGTRAGTPEAAQPA